MKRRVHSRWKFFVFLYITLLAVSQIIHYYYPPRVEPVKGQKIIHIDGAENQPSNPAGISIAYFDRHSGSSDNSPAILLLQGSPVAAGLISAKMMPALSRTGRVIAPDLPGFGSSTQSIADYSIQAHAAYMLDFLDRLGIQTVHIVAYSMGGGVAVTMAHMKPERVRSITMLSAIGVQEFELLGNYYINHALHGAQLAFIWLINNGLPHMGLLDRIPLNIAYARNFYDTDQRPLRGYLEQYQSPMLILHGQQDALVPPAAAHEHFRIVPQSELKLYDSGHFMISSRSVQLASDISDFILRVETGRMKTRAGADAARMTGAQQPFNETRVPPVSGVALVVLMLLIALATLISEDLTCIGAGLMAARGIIGLPSAVTASFAGILIGDILLFLAGKYLGRPALRYPPLKWMIKDADVARSSRWFAAKGPAIIIGSRFLPGSRLPTYFSAGVLDTGFWRFTLYFSVAAALWTPLLVGLSALIGSRMFGYYDLFRHYGILILLGTVFALWLMIKLIIPLFSFRGRRLLRSSICRKMRWEFWPPYIFYIPIVLYYVYLGLRFRSLTLFTAANPAIPEGGFIGESKTQILDNLAGTNPYVARYRPVKAGCSPENKIKQVLDFMREINTRFPIVIKPDVGQRGAGVTIIRSEKELTNHLSDFEGDVIVQEYVDGREYGVFYYRYPDEKTGRIFSITDKRLLKLTGDGQSTLEQLILMDDRAVCMARFHMRNHQQRLFQVPEKGEEIPLVEVGTHALGAMFLDGKEIFTPELEMAIDKISKHFKGFYFGRYDIRTPSIADFKRGKNFKIVELNGVTSEATHIYNPGNSLWYAYKVLMRQWRIAFEIGAVNRKHGIQPAAPGHLIGLLFK